MFVNILLCKLGPPDVCGNLNPGVGFRLTGNVKKIIFIKFVLNVCCTVSTGSGVWYNIN